MQTTGGRMPSDSDVRLIPDNTGRRDPAERFRRPPVAPRVQDGKRFRRRSRRSPRAKPPGDSDVALRQPGDSDVTLIAGDTSEHDSLFAAPGGSATPPCGRARCRVGVVGGSDAGLRIGDDSDFDLTPSSIEDALQPDSGSDFELSALEGSDEFEATPLAGPSDSDVTAADPGFSGINLSRPSDSGINLQMASGLGLGGADSIELAPLSGSNIKPMPAAPASPSRRWRRPRRRHASARAGKPEKDIFDDTDFEVDALDSDRDSDDRTMQLEAQSDFELEDADTGSEVFAIDEEDVDQNAATALGPAGASARGRTTRTTTPSAATAGEMRRAPGTWRAKAARPPPAAGRAAPSPVLASAGASAEWGGLWVGMLGVATLFMLFLTFVSLDLVRNLYDFRGDSPASGIVKSLAGLIGG